MRGAAASPVPQEDILHASPNDTSKINWLVEKYPDGVCHTCATDALGDEYRDWLKDREWSATVIQTLARGYLARK